MDLPGFICLGSFSRARIIRSGRRRARRRRRGRGRREESLVMEFISIFCFYVFCFFFFSVLQLTLMTLKPKLRFASTPAMRLLPNIPSNGSSISIFCKQNGGRGQCGQSNEKCCSVLFCAVSPSCSLRKKKVDYTDTTHGATTAAVAGRLY